MMYGNTKQRLEDARLHFGDHQMLANDPVWQNLRPHRLAALIA
jgi:hypothetical protein